MRYKNYRNENGGVVKAHVVTEATEGDVMTVDGGRKALVGDVVVPSQNEYFVDVFPADEWGQNWSEVSDEELAEAEETETERVVGGVQKGYDPSQHTAREVNDYLKSVGSQDEYERVAAAERDGRNRSSAIPDRDWSDE